MKTQLLVFDMDGVLVEVSESYRETIVQTVKIFTGQTITRELIQEYKNRGGYNNDWVLSRKICHDLGVSVAFESVVEAFNDLFLTQGLINRERWIPENGLLDRLAERFELAIFTGRSTMEAEITLNRQCVRDRFLLVTSSDIKNEKPAPVVKKARSEASIAQAAKKVAKRAAKTEAKAAGKVPAKKAAKAPAKKVAAKKPAAKKSTKKEK